MLCWIFSSQYSISKIVDIYSTSHVTNLFGSFTVILTEHKFIFDFCPDVSDFTAVWYEVFMPLTIVTQKHSQRHHYKTQKTPAVHCRNVKKIWITTPPFHWKWAVVRLPVQYQPDKNQNKYIMAKNNAFWVLRSFTSFPETLLVFYYCFHLVWKNLKVSHVNFAVTHALPEFIPANVRYKR